MSRPGSMRKRRGLDASPSSNSPQAGLEPCHTCGRTFLPDVLARHLPICAKVFNSKRRVFESGRQRIAGTGISITKIVRPDKIKKQGIKKTNWRQNHADFVNAIRSARRAQHAINTGKPLPPPPPPSINPDYIQCPHCGRRFNQTAAARHINFCGERTNTFGSPVKPLNKRAAADVHGSKVAIRKAYDNIVVRRKPSTNPYAYAQGDGNDEGVKVYSAAFGGSGPDQQASTVTARRNSTSPRRKIASPRQSSRRSSTSLISLSPRQQSSPRQQPSPRQQTLPNQRTSPGFKQFSRESSSLLSHPSTSPRFQSSSQPSASLLPQTASMKHSPLRSLPPATQHPSWQAPTLPQKLPSPSQELTTIQPLSSSSPHQHSSPSQIMGPAQISPPPIPQASLNSLPPWQQALKTSSSRSPPKAARLPNGHIRRSRLIKSGKPKGNVRFADNVQVKTFGDTLPGPDDVGGPADYEAPSQSVYASHNAMPNSFDEQLLSRHQDLMSVLKKNYGDDVMLATPGNHIEEMMQSRHPTHPLPNYGGMGHYGNQGGHEGGGIPDLTPMSTGLQRSSALNASPSHLPPSSMMTSYQDSFGRTDHSSFNSTTPFSLNNPSGLSNEATSNHTRPPQGYGRRPRPVVGSLRGPVPSKPSPSDFSKLSISGGMHGGAFSGM
ncbi:uncharacterized protein LOC121416932 isoform X2 [Lytechinus variegatus]|uniref:uncharacterized protein LOC121416932 isoform X2 n=1 Tax=Lytechinus variegatus TaxID=7654 RepID=UPI001BB1E84C|nr:uncharacterized protein LOC121416932 isoform X2 [Lytechinus variegatus]